MKQLAFSLVAASMLALPLRAAAQVAAQAPVDFPPLEVGVMAPDFAIPGATRHGVLRDPVKLSDYRGKAVVLAFFFRARTRGRTIQMHAYRDQYAQIFHDGQDVVLIGISTDSPEALASWARDDQFQFLMASDSGTVIGKQYGAIRGNTTNRNLFVVGPDGRIAYRETPFREIDPMAYTALGQALDRMVPRDSTR